MTQEGNQLVTVDAVSKRLAVSVFTVRRLIKAREIRAVHVGKRVLIPSSEVERIIEEGCGSRANGQ